MQHSPYLDLDRDREVLEEIVREFEAGKHPAVPAAPPSGGNDAPVTRSRSANGWRPQYPTPPALGAQRVSA